MKYSKDITIAKPRSEVISLFDNPDNMSKWQEGFVSFTPASGEPGKPGSTAHLVYQMGNRRIEMLETIITRNLPDEFAATYEAKGVWNHNINRFSDTGDGHTHWSMDCEFKCSGFIKVLAFFMPGMFANQTVKMMKSFKEFAEAH